MVDPHSPRNGRWWLNAIKGLTLTNVLVIILLILVSTPVYIIYRALNDEVLLDRFLSHLRELSAQQTNCTLREARLRGGKTIWAISTGFAYQGADRYLISVGLEVAPTTEQLYSYCETLNLIVDFMRESDVESPNFPGTDIPIVRKYRANGG